MAVCRVGDYLLSRLREVGIRHVLGVPGDYQLEFLDQIEAMDGIEWVGNCNELNAAHAADGYSRLNGIAALVTTFSVGELSALNTVAAALDTATREPDRLAFVEAFTQRLDAPESLVEPGKAFTAEDYHHAPVS
ncbi:thiamine pyrophosphate-binding protein [Actinopolymorpha pittospori]|uniref:TPP-dependent 2-oxoacid decarboxylase n=1 Tax=Actinopolymorpha pittospori TaxID=648752 RepID=A0A927N9P9_9ACTN|nr:thiamine pyrophosphate-binding protein [Actinopolymorpha pittospori]MBE1612823.1 TPP-dependent 2-oxoacid decarboxylase [Actinopolymorpha pittospori]